MKKVVKAAVNGLFLVLLFIPALLSGFGRCGVLFSLFAQAGAMVPGIVGEYVRRAYYAMTLRSCSMSSRISFGTFFAHREAEVGDGVYVGAYCVIGRARIGPHTQMANGVHVLSGRHQHARDEEGNILGAERGRFEDVCIGANCWIGTLAIVMANVGNGTTIGAGSVVTKDIPAGVVAVGNPAHVIKPAAGV